MMHEVGSLGFSVELQDMAKFAKDLEDAQRMMAAGAGSMAKQLEQVKTAINEMAAAERARASLFDRTLAESGRLMEVFKRGARETSEALENLKIDPDAMKVPQEAIQSLQEWRDKAVYAMGSAAAVGWEKTKTAWEEFKSWAERQVTIWGVGLAVGVSAAVLSAVYAAYKGVSFGVGLLTGESYKSKNIDALIAQTDQAKELGQQLQITSQKASALADALGRLGVPKTDYVSVWTQAASAVRKNTDELDRLGIAYKDSNGELLDTKTFLENVQKALGDYRDGWDRAQAEAAIGVGSYDKVTKALQVTEKEISNSRARLDDFNLGVGKETQEAVDAYQKSMREFNNESKLTSEGFKRAVADNIMPILTDLADFFKDGFPTAVRAFRYMMAEVMSLFYGLKTVVYLVAESVVGSISSIGSVLGGLATAAGRALKGDFTGAKDALVSGWNDAKARLGQIGDNIVEQARRNAKAMKLAWGFDDRSGTETASAGGNKPWTPPPPKPDGAAQEGQKQYDALIKRIKEKIAAQDLEISMGRKLTEQEQFEVKVRTDLAELLAKYPGLSKAQIEALTAVSHARANALAEEAAQLHNNANYAKQWAKEEEELAAAQKQRDDEKARLANTMFEQRRDLEIGNELLAKEAQLLGTTDRERETTLGQLKIELDLKRQIDDLDHNLKLDPEARDRLKQQAADNAEIAKQQVAARAELNEHIRILQSIDSVAHDIWTNIFEGGSNAFKSLGKVLKRELIDELYKLTLKRWIVQITGVVSGSGGAAGAAVSALSSGSAAMNGLGVLGAGYQAATGAFTGASTASMAYANGVGMVGGDSLGALIAANGGWAGVSAGTGLGAAAGDAAAMYGVEAGAGAAAAGGVGAAAGAMSVIPVIGWAIAAAALLYSIFGKKGGGPKVESGFGPGVWNTNQEGVQPTVQSIQDIYRSIVGQNGGTAGDFRVGLFTGADPRGTAQTQLVVDGLLNGQSVYNRLNRFGGNSENVGRSQEELQAAITEETNRVVLSALQASDVPSKLGAYLKSLGNLDALSGGSIQKAMDRVTKITNESRALDDKWFDLTSSAKEKQDRQRQIELASLDELSRAQAARIYALQDEIAKQQQVTAVLGNLQKNVSAYIDRLNATGAGLLSPESQLSNARLQYERQLGLARGGDSDAIGSITSYGDQLIQSQVAYGASSTATMDLINYVRQTLSDLPTQIKPEDVIAKAVADSSATVVDNLQDLIAHADANAQQLLDTLMNTMPQYLKTAMDIAGGKSDMTAPAMGGTPAPAPAPTYPSYQDLGDLGMGGSTGGFASGGAFTNGIVMRPTMFRAGGTLNEMGEAGPEGVLPLANVGGKLGVHFAGGSDSALREEVRGLREDVRNMAATLANVSAAGARRVVAAVGEVADNTADAARNARLDRQRAPV